MPNDSFYNTGIATYVWIITKDKPVSHREHVLLIDASGCFEQRRKAIGNKRVDITEACRNLIIEAYGDYDSKTYEKKVGNGKTIVVKSKRMESIALGYNKITVESPVLGDDGEPMLKKGKPTADTSKRDTETVPLNEDIDTFFNREVLPFREGAWIDRSKTKVGYLIPFTSTFYEYEAIEPSIELAQKIEEHERNLMESLHSLFGNGGM